MARTWRAWAVVNGPLLDTVTFVRERAEAAAAGGAEIVRVRIIEEAARAKVRVGAAARRRIRAGGPLAKGRPAASAKEWDAIKRQVFGRDDWRCRFCRSVGEITIHHCTKRSQGGSDFDLDQLVTLCGGYPGSCHDRTDWEWERGRLVIRPLGHGQFDMRILYERPADA